MSSPDLTLESDADRRARRLPWLVLAGAVVMQIATAPGQTVGVSVFVDHLSEDLELSRSAVSAAYLVGTLAGAVTMPAAGRLIDRRGLRFATLVFTAGFGAVLIAMSSVVGFVTLTIGFVGIRAFGQGALTLTATTTVAVWFDEKRGVANGIRSAFGGGLMAVVPVLSVLLIAGVGWRGAWVVLGVAAMAVLFPLGRWLIRDPRTLDLDLDLDLGADGDGASDPSSSPARADRPLSSPEPAGPARPQPSSAPSSGAVVWPVAAVMRHPAFWAMTAASSLTALIGTGLMFHHVDLMAGQGLSETAAAATFVPLTLASAAGALVAGRFADRTSPRLLIAIGLVVLAIATVLVDVISGPVTAALYGIMLGVAVSSVRTVEETALPRWFGIVTIGQIRGVVMAALVGGSAIGPLIVSLGLDAFGSYPPMLNILAGVSLALAAATLFVDPPGSTPTARVGSSPLDRSAVHGDA